MKHLRLVLFLFALPAFPQSLDFGFKAGVPLTDAFKHGITAPLSPSTYRSDTRRYTLGPTVELRLPFGLGIEFDALYKRLGFESELVDSGNGILSETRANSWEFPLLLKLRTPGIIFRPFLDGGVSFRTLSGVKQFVTGLAGSNDTPPELRDKHTRGFVFGAGFEVSAPFVKISPEFRYTRWAGENFRDTLNLLRTNQNQADFLIGITF
jgi:Outer membrane protein beta-barrel domain